MPNRIIKESIWTSPNLNRLSRLAERHFYRLIVLPDDFGCCELTPLVVRGRCYPLQPETTPEEIEIWQQELEDNGLVIRWVSEGRQYGIFPSFGKHQRIRSLHQRRTPVPPDDVLSRLDVNCRQMSPSDDKQPHDADDTRCQLSSNDRLNPNPNQNPNPIPNHNHKQTPLNPPAVCPSLESVINAYQDNILLGGTVSEGMENELRVACQRYTPGRVASAIKESLLQNQPTWRYIMGILQNWSREGKETTEGQ